MSQNPALAYRPDIDGLRAIAVLSVVFYHFGIGGLSGGFVGVDVFFVISGYLITGIIWREIELGKFTFTDFYERRVRRIFPALFVMLLVVLVTSCFLLLPTDLVLLGKSTLATLFFASNIFFWRTSGYFDPDSDLNPLLHTWSLAVEEQFYIGLPFLLLAAYRWKREWLTTLIAIALVASFISCLWVMQDRPIAGFYLSPFRAWELLAGSILAVRGKSVPWTPFLREFAAWVAFLVLILSIWLVKSGPGFPGWQALVPVAATVCLIYIHENSETGVSRLLSLKPLVWIGLISYSLYLWHWPVLFFTNYLNAFEPPNYQVYLGAIISLLLAVASYRYVEKPFRRNIKIISPSIIYSSALSASLILVTISTLLWNSAGMPTRFSTDVQALDKERSPHIPFKECDTNSILNDKINDKCLIGKKSVVPSVVVWGDSHAMSIAPALSTVFDKKGISGIIVPNSGCPSVLQLEILNDLACLSQNKEVIGFIQNNENLKTIILHSYWGFYTGSNSWKLSEKNGKPGLNYLPQSIDYTIRKLNQLGKNVVVIGQVPTSPTTPTEVALRKAFDLPAKAPFSYAEFQNINRDFSDALSKVSPERKYYYLDLSQYMCDSLGCDYMIGVNNVYRDTDHLSISGAQHLESFLERELPVY